MNNQCCVVFVRRWHTGQNADGCCCGVLGRLVWNLTSVSLEYKSVGATVTLHQNFLLEQLRQEHLNSSCSVSFSERVAWGPSGRLAAEFQPPSVFLHTRAALDSLLEAGRQRKRTTGKSEKVDDATAATQMNGRTQRCETRKRKWEKEKNADGQSLWPLLSTALQAQTSPPTSVQSPAPWVSLRPSRRADHSWHCGASTHTHTRTHGLVGDHVIMLAHSLQSRFLLKALQALLDDGGRWRKV